MTEFEGAEDDLTVVLVHGAFADASSWSAVVAQLLAAGLDVRAVANPLRGLAADARYLVDVAAEVRGRVLLVGHSYGGAVITNAAGQLGNVAGLVFVTAFAPEAGESLTAIVERFPDTLMGPALRQTEVRTGHDDTSVELSIDRAQFPAVFAADVPATTAAVMAASQRPIALAGFVEASGEPAWRALPSWYLVAADDQAIHVDAQRSMAQRAGSHIAETAGSHAVMVSQPTAVADVILTAARTLR
ncbi:alpha/beta fold hydrolase [Dactylosporangium siamense]|uniref:Alpha/beta hydrolase n=1 Tax=Dactylosporangium siamense TaxID=685454 RepID=A0A919PGZ1_9ACTN|nr:alpha/beta hydrolase [Dactylosporangium siamense]GIG44017.1 alpha/beta hydrolase [Dactylosporangium siamense]